MAHQVIDPVSWSYAEIPSADLPNGLVEWNQCSQFPTEIHLELRAAGKIPDWNKGRAEHDVQWVSERHWAFRGELLVDQAQLKGMERAELEFESLDTFATIYLNGQCILETDNHFTTHKVEVPVKNLKSSNELTITFKPPGAIAKEISKKFGPFRGGSCNLGDRSRMGIRKSQYSFRWDWGPEIKCIGPDRPLHLHLYSSRLMQVHTAARVDEDLKRSLKVEVESCGPDKTLKVELLSEDGQMIRCQDGFKGKTSSAAETGAVTIAAVDWGLGDVVDLWWPVREGKQTRYTVKVNLVSEMGEVLDTVTRKIGFRRMELIQRPLEDRPGTSFFFQVNNRPIFCAGSNWIPIDNVLPSGTPERYRRWLELLIHGNQNMIRIWGGGVFEPDIFYDLCDELGILVWQDFMFACGVYPIFPEFMDSVQKEAECNVKRLRHHPSMALFCGNNEDYQMILQWDMDQSGDPLPARKIYEHLLPETVTRLTDPEIPYHRGSPFGGKGWDTADPTIGDVHQWDVWGGKEKYYQDWDILGGRFVSEFGMPSMPDIRTIDFWLDGDQSERYSQSRLMQQHNKAGSHERRLAIYMNENFRIKEDLESYAFLTRLMQSEAVGLSYSLWRREWKGPKKEYCAGVLVWQLNDCWPVTSWAIVDYFYRPKPAYFTVARASAPYSLGLRRTVEKNRETDRPRTFYEYGAFQSRTVTVELWGCNSTQTGLSATVHLKAMDMNKSWAIDLPSQEVTLAPNQSTDIWSGPCPQPPEDVAYDRSAPSGNVVLHATLMGAEGQVIARTSNWPEPYKLLQLADPGLEVKVEGDEVTVNATKKPCKGVWLDVEGENQGVMWSDNALDVFPGDPVTVRARGLAGKRITVAHLGSEKPNPV